MERKKISQPDGSVVLRLGAIEGCDAGEDQVGASGGGVGSLR